MAGGSIALGKGEGHKNGNSILGRGSEFKRGEAGAKAFRGGKKGEPKANRKRNPRKNKSPKPGKVVGSFKGRVERKSRENRGGESKKARRKGENRRESKT